MAWLNDESDTRWPELLLRIRQSLIPWMTPVDFCWNRNTINVLIELSHLSKLIVVHSLAIHLILILSLYVAKLYAVVTYICFCQTIL
jgi:hypothetical protein